MINEKLWCCIVGYGGTGAGGTGSAPLTPQQCKTITANSLLANTSNAAQDKMRVWPKPVHYPFASIYSI